MLARMRHGITSPYCRNRQVARYLFRGKKWEIKPPKGAKRRTIENNIRNTLKQSRNIIVDLDLTIECGTVT